MLFRQLFDTESSTFTYLIADEATRQAAIIDPVREQSARDLQILHELDLRLIYVLETHVHADHVTGAGKLREATGAKTVLSAASGVSCADVFVEDGQRLTLGELEIQVLSTPGHTSGCVSYAVEGRVFTGDALLIRGSGRTDFQSGSAEQLYDSVTKKLFTLPDATLVYPGHDYKGWTHSTIGEEKRFNPRLAGKNKTEFVALMQNLNLPKPKKIDLAVPANLLCGTAVENTATFHDTVGAIRNGTVAEIGPADLDRARKAGARLIDVRTPAEFAERHLPDAELVPVDAVENEARAWDRKRPIVTVCRSGARSARAAQALERLGFCCVASLRGGMNAVGGSR